MIDVKPYAHDEPTQARDRSVAALLVFSGLDKVGEVPSPLQPFGGSCLFDIALRCIERLGEAAERALWTDDAGLREPFEREPCSSVRLLPAPPDQSLQRGTPDGLLSTHVVLLDGRYPFLRPNSIDEAIRLLKMRPDIDSIVSCVRTSGVAYDLSSAQRFSGRGDDAAMLMSCRAFWIVPAETVALGQPPQSPPFAFELSQSESFRVHTPFTRDLAGPYLASRRCSDAADSW